MKYFLITLTLAFSSLYLLSCGDSDDGGSGGFNSGVPSVDETLRLSTPADFTNLANTSSSVELSSITDEASLRNFIKQRIFTNCANGTLSQCTEMTWYRKWTEELDNRITSLESRFEDVPDCVTETSTLHNFTVGSNTVPMYFSCWETHSVPTGVEFQRMAFGSNGDDFYLMITTKFDSTSGIAFLAKANSTGDVAEIWSLGRNDNGDSLIRTFANQGSGEISHFYSTNQPNNMEGLCSIFGRTDGTNAFFVAQDNSSSSCATTVLADSGCKDANDISAAGSDCSAINTAPSDFGTLTTTDNSDVSDSNFSTEVSTIIDFDFSSAGIAEL